MLLGVALVAMLLATQPVGAQTTGDCEEIGDVLSCSYVEHSTGRVYDFHADTAGATFAWTLVTEDAAYPDDGDFSIDQESGLLAFKSPPNYESPMDGTAGGTGDAARDNTYRVKIQVEVDTAAGRTTTEQEVTVTVTNKEEDGTVTLNNLQPQVRELITAALADPDGSVFESTWQWSRSSSRNGVYTPIAGATEGAYRPVDGDTDMYLRATVTYTDGHGPEVDTAMTEPMNHPVRAETGADNVTPAFAEDAVAIDTVKTANREIDENTPAGTNIGPPVFATDDDLDVLTYSLSGGADQSKFAISAENGQIMTKASLNFENLGEPGECADAGCVVEVTVKDPLGNRVDNPALDTITVTITVNDLNEAPAVSGPVLLIRHEESGGMILDSDQENNAPDNVIFGATDPDEGQLTAIVWELSGPDASKFMIGPDATVDTGAASEPLQFRAAPNFESPGDANKDNVYQVTVVARDSQLATGSRAVTIRVTNVEETGGVSLSHIQPEVATRFTATMSDPDGGITGLKWQWYRGTYNTANADTAPLPTTVCAGNADSCLISGATSSSYVPKPSDAGS